MTAGGSADQVGLIGLGVMGSAAAGLLLRRGTVVAGYDVAGPRMEQLRAAGGRPLGSPAEVAAQCPVVLTALPTPQALHEVISGPAGLAAGVPAGAGPLTVEMSTLSLADKTLGKQALERAGGRMADAPLSGTGAQAVTGDLVAFVSADEAADRAAAAGVMAGFSRAQYDVGAFGNGSRFKFVANLLVAIHNVAAAEALVLAEQAGLDLPLVLAAVADGAGGSRMLEVRGPLMTGRSYDNPSVRLQVFQKDVGLITEFARGVGAATPLLAASAAIYDAAQADGRAGQDTACVAEVLRQAAGTGPAGGAGPDSHLRKQL